MVVDLCDVDLRGIRGSVFCSSVSHTFLSIPSLSIKPYLGPTCTREAAAKGFPSIQNTHGRPPFTLPATLPVTRIFPHYPTRTLPEVKKPYPSQPAEESVFMGLVVRSCHFDVTACAEARRLALWASHCVSRAGWTRKTKLS